MKVRNAADEIATNGATGNATLVLGFNVIWRLVMKAMFIPCLVTLGATACGGLPPPVNPHSGSGNGCVALSDAARVRASQTSALGWGFAIAGAGATAAGATVLPLDGTLSRQEKIVAGSLIAGGALLLTVSHAWFKRSDAASTLAGEAASILGARDSGKPLADDQMGAKCDVALSAWEKSRADATAVASTLLQEQKKTEAADDRDSETRMEKEKTLQKQQETQQKQLDFKLKTLQMRPNLSPEQIQELTLPPAEPQQVDKPKRRVPIGVERGADGAVR